MDNEQQAKNFAYELLLTGILSEIYPNNVDAHLQFLRELQSSITSNIMGMPTLSDDITPEFRRQADETVRVIISRAMTR